MMNVFKDGLNIFEALLSLSFDVSGHHFTGAGIDGELCGKVIVMGEGDCLRIGTDAFWRAIGINGQHAVKVTHRNAYPYVLLSVKWAAEPGTLAALINPKQSVCQKIKT
jgi:hypothetical protein